MEPGIFGLRIATAHLGITSTDALAPTVALDTIALTKGASFIRVHDVLPAVQSVKLFELTTD